MLYLFCIILPPLAVFLCGFKPLSFIINIILTCLGWLPGMIHAILVVNEAKADKRVKKIEKKIEEQNKQDQ